MEEIKLDFNSKENGLNKKTDKLTNRIFKNDKRAINQNFIRFHCFYKQY